MSDTALGDTVCRILTDTFGFKASVSRYSKRDRQSVRPYGIRDVSATDGSQEVLASVSEVASDPSRLFEPIQRAKDVDLGDPFETEKCLVWMSDVAEQQNFAEIQSRILAERNKSSLRAMKEKQYELKTPAITESTKELSEDDNILREASDKTSGFFEDIK